MTIEDRDFLNYVSIRPLVEYSSKQCNTFYRIANVGRTSGKGNLPVAHLLRPFILVHKDDITDVLDLLETEGLEADIVDWDIYEQE